MSERIEIPYGLRIAADGQALEECEHEQRVLRAILGGLVDDRSLGDIAVELNAAGLRTRGDTEWSASLVFDLLPRVVESGPSIFRTSAWQGRTRRGLRAV